MNEKSLQYVRWCWKSFCLIIFDKKKLKRDAVILGLLIFFLVGLLSEKTPNFHIDISKYAKRTATTVPEPIMAEEEIYKEVKEIQTTIDSANWKTHQSQWYGFEIKYPDDWVKPISQAPRNGEKWEYRHQFRKGQLNDENPYIGFDLIIYNILKTKELSNTKEFPALYNEELKTEEKCLSIEGHVIETGDYPAEEIYIPPSDDCYHTALFFSNTRDAYIYNIIPILKEEITISGDPRIEIANDFPEFYSVISTFALTDFVRPKPVPPKQKMTNAPMPAAYKVVNGKRVCSKNNDRPSKSKQNKGRHMDMECCLDPDEYPNPNCYYPVEKYGKYL